MGKRMRRLALGAAALTVLASVTVGCSSSGSDSGSGSGDTGSLEAIRVPQDYKTIQQAVNAAKPGDLVLVDKGVYREAVDVTTNDITIRGVDRNKVILDGGFKLENGIRVLDTDGVQVENMTARNYLSNGFFWTGSDRYRGSYLTAYRNGDYALYAFDAYHGQFDHSIGAGSPDAGVYIGECYKCDALIDNVLSEYNGLGYSGTNSGGDLYIVNSEFRYNRAGVVPNSGSYELCYPSRGTVVAGNLVHDNNYLKGDGIDVSLIAQGNGILLAGAVDATVTKNRVYNHDRTGIAAVPFPESDAQDVPPPKSEHTRTCDSTRKDKLPDKSTIPGTVLWPPTDNRFIANVVSGSGLADLASATLVANPGDPSTEQLNNCFSDNTYKTTSPTNLEQLAPCTGAATASDWTGNVLDLVSLIADQPPKPKKDTYRTTPIPAPGENMPGALTKKPTRYRGPKLPNIDAITVPEKP